MLPILNRYLGCSCTVMSICCTEICFWPRQGPPSQHLLGIYRPKGWSWMALGWSWVVWLVKRKSPRSPSSPYHFHGGRLSFPGPARGEVDLFFRTSRGPRLLAILGLTSLQDGEEVEPALCHGTMDNMSRRSSPWSEIFPPHISLPHHLGGHFPSFLKQTVLCLGLCSCIVHYDHG